MEDSDGGLSYEQVRELAWRSPHLREKEQLIRSAYEARGQRLITVVQLAAGGSLTAFISFSVALSTADPTRLTNLWMRIGLVGLLALGVILLVVAGLYMRRAARNTDELIGRLVMFQDLLLVEANDDERSTPRDPDLGPGGVRGSLPGQGAGD